MTDALVLDIVHRHLPCSASFLPLPASSPLPISPPISLRYYKTDFQVGQTQERSVRDCITCDLPQKDGQFHEDRDILLLSASHTQLHNNLTPSSTTTPHPAPQQPHTSSTATQLHDNTRPVVFLCQQAKEEAELPTKMRRSLDCINTSIDFSF